MKISKTFKSSDPFAHLYYPNGATGLLLRIVGYWFAKDKSGYYYVLRDVIESRDYTDASGKARMGVTQGFTDTYWRLGTKAECRILVMRLRAGKAKKHYETMFKLVPR